MTLMCIFGTSFFMQTLMSQLVSELYGTDLQCLSSSSSSSSASKGTPQSPHRTSSLKIPSISSLPGNESRWRISPHSSLPLSQTKLSILSTTTSASHCSMLSSRALWHELAAPFLLLLLLLKIFRPGETEKTSCTASLHIFTTCNPFQTHC